jgi:enoyl-CoA hydratase/carnithine racemase
MNDREDPGLAAGNRIQPGTHHAKNSQRVVESGVGRITLNRPERNNPLSFESHASLRGLSAAKTMLHQEWDMGIDQAIESEAQAQAICMMGEDLCRAYDAFVAKAKPRFEGN